MALINSSYERLKSRGVFQVLILFICSILISCQKSDSLNGSWINVSSFSGDGEPSFQAAQSIYEFDNGQLRIIQLGNHANGDYFEVTEEACAYDLNKNLLFLKRGLEVDTLEYVLNDSLVLTYWIPEREKRYSIVFKKMNLTKRFTGKLYGSYKMSWPEDSMYISFLKDSIFISDRNHAGKWAIYNHKGASILIRPFLLNPVSSIWDGKGDSIHLSYHFKPERRISLVRAKSFDIKQNLIGEWIRVQNDSLQPPPPPGFAEGEFQLHITFEPDTLTINYFDGPRKEAWKITEDGRNIYFPERILSKDGVWKIESYFENDSMIIYRGDEARVWYKKS